MCLNAQRASPVECLKTQAFCACFFGASSVTCTRVRSHPLPHWSNNYSSSLSSFQNPSHCPSSWDLVGMPGAIDPCPQYWFISRAFRNKITHILNGNHGPKKPWYQQHSQACDALISIGTLNIGGLQEAVKRKRLKEIAKDILVVTETHLQNHLEF